MQSMHSRRTLIAPAKAFGGFNVLVPLAVSRTPAVRRGFAGHHVRAAANLDVSSHNQHSRSQVELQTETLLQPQGEHMAIKALKVAVLVPVLFSVMWTDPAHAARRGRQAKSAAAQIVELTTAEEHKSPLEQLQAQINSFIHKITDKISHRSDDQAAAAAAAAADQGFLAQVPSKISNLQQRLLERLQQPEVRTVLAATVALLVFALLIRSSQSSSNSSTKSAAAPAAGSGSDGGGSGSSSTIKVTVPADAATRSGATNPAPVFATIAGNGTGSNVKVSVTIPAAATAAPAAATQQQQQKGSAESTVQAKKLVKTIRDTEDRINATAAAAKREVKASAAAATAAVDKAKAAADRASSSLKSRSASPINPEPPKVVKPNITKSPASTPATSQLAGSSPAPSQLAGFGSSSSSSSRPSSPPAIPNVPDKGAATPALTVIGAGAILFDLMMPLGKLAVASARSAAGLPSNVTNDSNTTGSSSSGGSSRARTSGASSRPSTPKPKPKPKPAPAAPAAPPAPPKPPQQSKLAKAVAAAAAAESAVMPRSVPTELPPVTLEELEAALRASGKMT